MIIYYIHIYRVSITQHLYNCHNCMILLHNRTILQHSCTIMALCGDSQHRPMVKISSLSSYTNVRSSRHVHHASTFVPIFLQGERWLPRSIIVSSQRGWHSCLFLMYVLHKVSPHETVSIRSYLVKWHIH